MSYTISGPHTTGMSWSHYGQGFESCNYPGPYLRGSSERYLISEHSTGEADGLLDVFRSPDSGVTWTPQDAANMPATFNTGVCTARVNADTIRICYAFYGATYPIAAIRDFDLATNTLGPVLYDLSSFHPTWSIIKPVYQRSSVASEDRIFASAISGGLVGNVLALFRHDGSGFLPLITIDAGGVYPDDYSISPEVLFMDPAGTSHVIYSKQRIFHAGVPQPDYGWRYFYYVQVNAAGVATAPVLVYTYQIGSTAAFGFPALLGNKLVFPFGNQHGTTASDQFFTGSMLVMDPYTSPTPTITQVDPPTEQVANYGLSTPIETPSINATTLNSLMYLWWIDVQGLDGVTPLSRIRYATWNGAAFGPPTTFYDNIATPLIPTGGVPLTGMAPTYMDVADPMIAVNGAFLFTINPIPLPVPPATTQGSRRSHILVPNHFDKCLDTVRHLYEGVDPRKVCCEPILWHNINWIRAPKNFIPFRKVAAIPTPLAITGDVEVVGFNVPTGYDGIIAGVFNVYTGPGFQEGNGDLQWRIRINRVYAVQLGLIQVTLGSRAQPFAVDGGIQVQSGQRISYIVSAPNLSGGILPINSQIVCGLEGLFYARQ